MKSRLMEKTLEYMYFLQFLSNPKSFRHIIDI